jgi:hypothetical protein
VTCSAADSRSTTSLTEGTRDRLRRRSPDPRTGERPARRSDAGTVARGSRWVPDRRRLLGADRGGGTAGRRTHCRHST